MPWASGIGVGPADGAGATALQRFVASDSLDSVWLASLARVKSTTLLAKVGVAPNGAAMALVKGGPGVTLLGRCEAAKPLISSAKEIVR